MEAVMMYGLLDQSISPYKSPITNPRNIHYNVNPFMSLPSENYFQSNSLTTPAVGLLQPPPPYLSRSYPPFPLQSQSSLPPLLPLPAGAAPLRRASSRGFSSPKKPTNGRIKDSTLKSSKSLTKSPKKADKIAPENVTVSSEDVPKVLPLNSPGSNTYTNSNNTDSLGFGPKDQIGDDRINVEKFSGSAVFTISSPPPSSLPLPTFSLRPKLSCNVEAAGIDTGATDGLRRLLRLR